MKKLLKLLIAWWGDVGYLIYDELKYEKKLTSQEKQDLIVLLNIYWDNLALNNKNLQSGLIVNYENPYFEEGGNSEISELVEVIGNFISKSFFTNILNQFKEEKIITLYKRTDNENFLQGNIDPFHWMSWSKSEQIDREYGEHLIKIEGKIKFVDTLIDGQPYADFNEVLIYPDDLHSNLKVTKIW